MASTTAVPPCNPGTFGPEPKIGPIGGAFTELGRAPLGFRRPRND